MPTDRPSLIRVFAVATLSWLIAVSVVTVPGLLSAAEEPGDPRGPFENIHVIDFDGDIEALMLAYVTRRVDTAKEDGADCIVLRVDSPGGTVFHGKKIGDMLLDIPDEIHVVAWVPQLALSGAAFISLACDEVIMKAAASLGDSQPIVQGEGGKPEPVGEKFESPLRAWFRAYAEENGYPAALAEAMVTADIEVIRVRSKKDESLHFLRGTDFRNANDDAELVPGHAKSELVQDGPAVVRKGELLTMTGQQALEYGFIKRRFDGGLPTDEDQVLAALKAPGARVTFTKMSFSEKASKWLLQVAGILSAIVALAILLFVWQGPGIMTVVGGIALVLVVLINLTAEQLHGFPIFLILLGVGLLAAEVFIIPGFGVAGILGMASLAVGFLFLATGSTLGDTGAIDKDAILDFGLQFVFTAIVGFTLLLLMSRFFPRVGPASRMILQPSGAPAMAEGPAAADAPALGARGTATTALRPAGTAEFDGSLVDVVSDGTFIDAGATVQVVAVEGDRVTVAEA
ncbi:MAG: NfeD family protein [Planctomycetota bacterium]|nr:NfeD family protein [Planctomycetota bacterium]